MRNENQNKRTAEVQNIREQKAEQQKAESRETGNIRTSEQQKQKKPKTEWFEHTKIRETRS